MIADIIFIVYIIILVCAIGLCIHPKGIALQQEFMSFRTMKQYMIKRNVE